MGAHDARSPSARTRACDHARALRGKQRGRRRRGRVPVPTAGSNPPMREEHPRKGHVGAGTQCAGGEGKERVPWTVFGEVDHDGPPTLGELPTLLRSALRECASSSGRMRPVTQPTRSAAPKPASIALATPVHDDVVVGERDDLACGSGDPAIVRDASRARSSRTYRTRAARSTRSAMASAPPGGRVVDDDDLEVG